MTYNYDRLYKTTPDALGAPTQIFVDFFARITQTPLRVLDVGCGQGRDALFIARAGHEVVGVDLSANGISDLEMAAQREGLKIAGIVADITTFTPNGLFDIILIDRTLHMLPESIGQKVLSRLLDHVNPVGWVLIADESSNIAGFKDIFIQSAIAWRTEVADRGTLFMQHA